MAKAFRVGRCSARLNFVKAQYYPSHRSNTSDSIRVKARMIISGH